MRDRMRCFWSLPKSSTLIKRRTSQMATQPTTRQLNDAYALARERYASIGVDSDAALAALRRISLSLHCWQGDDVAGFESGDGALGGGLAATGNYPGKARNA